MGKSVTYLRGGVKPKPAKPQVLKTQPCADKAVRAPEAAAGSAGFPVSRWRSLGYSNLPAGSRRSQRWLDLLWDGETAARPDLLSGAADNAEYANHRSQPDSASTERDADLDGFHAF